MSIGIRKTTEEFVEQAKAVHGNKYDYSEVVYKNNSTPVKIFCKTCKKFFEQLPSNHLAGKGCKACGIISVHQKQALSLQEFINRAKTVHGDKYDYSEVAYKNSKTKIKIFCKRCNEYFYQNPVKHLHGQDCNCYKLEKLRNARAYTTEQFIKKAKKIHGDRFDYSKVNYVNQSTSIIIKCNKCGKYFWQLPGNHLAGKGCKYCRQSKSEIRIEKWLKNNNYKYVIQKRFKECKDKQQLPFDFYLPDYNLCIEFQGAQHYGLFNWEKTNSNFELRQKHDEIKKEFCKSKGIKLLEIKYDENFEEKLKEALQHE